MNSIQVTYNGVYFLEGATLAEAQAEFQELVKNYENDLRAYNERKAIADAQMSEYDQWAKANGVSTCTARGKKSAAYLTLRNQVYHHHKVQMRNGSAPCIWPEMIMKDGSRLRNTSMSGWQYNVEKAFNEVMLHYNAKKARSEHGDKLLLASMKYCIEHDLLIGDESKEQIKAIAHNHASEAFVKEEYPLGTEMEFNQCECSSWTVGQHRCSCGGRRVYLVTDGDLVRGFWAYAEAY